MHLLARFCEDVYLLARFRGPELETWARGRLWERHAAAALGLHTWSSQGPGNLKLFGCASASGFRHELDCAGHSNGNTIIGEAKAYTGTGPNKNDLCIFDRKTFDMYVARRRAQESGFHWRVLISATPLTDEVRKYCYLYGIVAVEPARLPLPMLLRIAGKPIADEFFGETQLAELVRLGEQATGPLEKRYVPEGHYLRFDLDLLRPQALDDLLWLQETLTAETLEYVDKQRPGFYENRTEVLLDRLGIVPSKLVEKCSESNEMPVFGQSRVVF